MDDQVTQAHDGEKKISSHTLLIATACFIAGALMAIAVDRSVNANYDYTCTRVIQQVGDAAACANGSWGEWQTVSSNDDAATCQLTTVQRRVYTGTRAVSSTLEFQSSSLSCDDAGSGSITSVSSACQVEETKTTSTKSSNPACANATVMTTENTESATTDIAGTSQTSSMSSLSGEQVMQFREASIAAEIKANPKLVKPGDTSTITWNSAETTSCTVTAPNGDRWTGTSGTQTSSPINELTTYSLTCQAFNGRTVTATASVGIIPSWNEI